MQNLSGKVAFVTGGSRGIGAAIAKRLAAEGAQVAITYANAAQKADEVVTGIEANGGRAIALQADNQDEAAISAAIDEAARVFGRLDILVNNAGVFDVAPIADLSLDRFDRTMDVNVRGVFVAVKAALLHMSDDGRIITVGSNLAKHVPWPGFSLYSMSKSALIGLTEQWTSMCVGCLWLLRQPFCTCLMTDALSRSAATLPNMCPGRVSACIPCPSQP